MGGRRLRAGVRLAIGRMAPAADVAAPDDPATEPLKPLSVPSEFHLELLGEQLAYPGTPSSFRLGLFGSHAFGTAR